MWHIYSKGLHEFIVAVEVFILWCLFYFFTYFLSRWHSNFPNRRNKIFCILYSDIPGVHFSCTPVGVAASVSSTSLSTATQLVIAMGSFTSLFTFTNFNSIYFDRHGGLVVKASAS